MTARLIGKIERGRVAALHRVQLADPIAPSASGSWWQRFKAMVTSGARWKEIAYALLRLPAGMLFTVVALHLWAGSMAVLLLPLYAGALPGDEAHFGLFDVSAGAEALLGVPVGLLGLLVVAPWATPPIEIGRASCGERGGTYGKI